MESQNPAGQAGRVAVVTGGASGFGRALGERFAAAGPRVALLDRDAERAAAEVAAIAAAERLTDDEWRWVLDVNVIGAARTAQAFLTLLRAAPRGRLAFTTSSSVLSPAARLGAYQASKFAVWGLAETLRLELAPEGISVSVLFPSGMASRHLETEEAAGNVIDALLVGVSVRLIRRSPPRQRRRRG